MDLSSLNLPDSVVDRIKFNPFEDLLMAIFKRGLPDLDFVTLIPEKMTYPLVFGQRYLRQSGWNGDPRFIDSGPVRINVFTMGINGELEAFYISEAIRNLFFQADRERWHFDGIGSVLALKMESEPADASDWATASGIVQFADLPKGVTRYETTYRMTVRRPES